MSCRTKRNFFAVVLSLSFYVLNPAQADTLEVLVTDSTGKPLSDAVVELVSDGISIEVPQDPLIMDQAGKEFLPRVLLAPMNSLVSFPNSDDIRHHVYSFSEAKTFELKLYAGKPESPLLFDKTGVVVLGCNIHDSMVGYIYIAGSKAVQTGDDGLVRIDPLPQNVRSMTVWHPDALKGVEHRERIDIPQTPNAKITVQISIQSPEPRNTFEDVFSSL